MNFSNIKKLVLPLCVAAVFSACDKPDTTDQLADNGQNIIRVNTYGGVDANFANSAIVPDLTDPTPLPTDFQLEYVGPHVFPNDLTVTVAINDAARVAYNATVPPANQFQSLDPSLYTLSTTTATIKAGGVFSTTLTFTLTDPTQLDPAVSYMVPVSITNVAGGSAGVKGAPSTGTAYFHVIGNPLAGNYHAIGYVYHPSLPRDVDEMKSLLPNSPDELFWDWGDLGYAGYFGILKTDPTTNKVTIRIGPGGLGGAFTQFDTDLPNSNPGYTPAWPNSAQCNNTYDPATKTFKLRVGYLNAASGWRVAEEFDTKL